MSTSAVVDILIPVFNEGKNIEQTISEIYAHVPVEKRVIVIHDFDEDDTVPVVRDLMPRYPGLMLLRNTLGRGVVNAVRAGIAAAESDVVIISMADLSDDLTVVPEMVRRISAGECDVVCASRYMRGGRQIGGPWLKGLLSRIAGVTLHWLAGFPSHDATNSFRAYRREVVKTIPIESTGGFEYTLELTAKAFVAGYRVSEVPSTWRDRTAGASKFRLAKWLPKYLRWYAWTLAHAPRSRRS